MKRRGVVLGFSGGIDSATAVGLLCAEGYEVTALTLDTIGDDKMLQHARSRAEELGVSPLEVTKFGGDSKLLQGYLFEEGKNHA